MIRIAAPTMKSLNSTIGRTLIWLPLIWLGLNLGRVNAAEKIVLKYRIFEASISVSELATFAETGELSPALQTYLTLAGRDPQELRTALTEKVNVSPQLLDRVLNSLPGEILLDQVGQVIHTPAGRADRQALRAAIVLSATPDSNLTLLEIMQNYPTSEVQVEGDRLVQVYNQLSTLINQVKNWL